MENSEWKTGVREGYRTKVMHIGNCTVRVHRPLLSDAERSKREEQVKLAMVCLMAENTSE